MRLIDAEKLFEEVGQIKPRNKEHYKTIGEFMNMITNSETINFRPKGKWISNPKDAIDSMFAKPKCSNCGFESADGGNFCSNCGADMKDGTKNE